MKRSAIIIIASILILLLLVFRLLYTHIDGLKEEKLWYVHQLNYDFSTSIDSVRLLNHREFGLIYFHEITGTLDASVEKRLNRQLKFNGDLRFILSRPDKPFVIVSFTIDKYAPGDSLVINTASDKITCYRGDKVVCENSVTENLSGRPF